MADLQMDGSGQASPGESCTTYASLLTALFDEEVDEHAARLARGHLERCARCADMWQAWESNRSILQAVPVPVPPVTLLGRILLACRLVALSRRTDVASSIRSAGGNGAVAPRSESAAPSYLNVPAPPPDLQDSILRLTTRRREQVETGEAPLDKTPLDKTPLVDLTPILGESHESQRRRSYGLNGFGLNGLWSRGGRFATLAVPAILLWVAFVSPTNEVPLQTTVSESTEALVAAQNHAASEDVSAAIAPPSHIAVAGKHVPAPKVAAGASPAKRAPSSPATVAVTDRVAAAEAEPEAPAHPAVTHSTVVHRNHDKGFDQDFEAPVRSHRSIGRERVEAVAALPQIAPKARPKIATVAAITTSLASQTRSSGIRVARYAPPVTPRTTTLREKVTDPSAADSSDIDVLQEVHGLDEGRSNDVRQVVEEYRASLISEISDNGEDDSAISTEEY